MVNKAEKWTPFLMFVPWLVLSVEFQNLLVKPAHEAMLNTTTALYKNYLAEKLHTTTFAVQF